jgi:hypothetical protein
MSKIVLDNISGGHNLQKINANFDKIEAEFANKVVYRDEAGSLSVDLDANGMQIYNLPAPTSLNSAARQQDVLDAVAGAKTAALTAFTPAGDITATNVQGAIEEVNTFTQAGTGVVVRTVQAKNREILSVADFGAVGDGVTDDTTAIQLALNTGKMVFLPAGTYKISARLLLMSNQLMYGEGPSSILRLADGVSGSLTNSNMIQCGTVNSAVSDLAIDGNATNNNVSYYSALSASASTGSKFYNLYISNVFGNAISGSSSVGTVISNIRFHDITGTTGDPGECIYLFASTRATITNIVATDIDDHVIYISGTTASPTTDIVVSNVVANNAGRSVLGSSAYNVLGLCINISFSNCMATDCDIGFTVNASSTDSSSPYNVLMTNCSAYKSYRSGFSFQGVGAGSDMNIVMSGIISSESGRSAAGVTAYGLLFSLTNKITMSGVQVEKSNDDGVRFALCKNINWTGGKSVDNSRRVGTATFYGIRFGDGTGTMSAGQVDNVRIYSVDTTDSAAAGKLQKRGFFFEVGSTNCSVTGGSHIGNETACWSKDATTDATCTVSGVGYANTQVTTPTTLYGTAVPSAFTWAVGDRVISRNPVVGSPKGWVCTVAGAPGTWVSEGNL